MTNLSKRIDTSSILSSDMAAWLASGSDKSVYIHVTRSPNTECKWACIVGKDSLQEHKVLMSNRFLL